MTIETERLFLREMNTDDYNALYAVLADSDIMQHYPYTFDEKRVRNWIKRNIERYSIFGFGLWAVCLKESGEMIGDCGLTMQNINGMIKPEIGYHIRKDMQRKGYAKEAATAVRDWAFRNTPFNTVFSYMKSANEPSVKTAISYGCHLVDEYTDEENTMTKVFAITRKEWDALQSGSIVIALADKTNITPFSLDTFDRFQIVKNVYRPIDGKLVLRYHPFTEDWSLERRREKVAEILSGDYIVYCAFDGGKVAGGIMLLPQMDNNRLIIESFHVSREYRRHGLGRALFNTAVQKAKEMGAKSLYASACSAEETIRFYLAMGFVPTKNPIRQYAEDEPFDIQMECVIQ